VELVPHRPLLRKSGRIRASGSVVRNSDHNARDVVRKEKCNFHFSLHVIAKASRVNEIGLATDCGVDD
jgi:hypothetical protein